LSVYKIIIIALNSVYVYCVQLAAFHVAIKICVYNAKQDMFCHRSPGFVFYALSIALNVIRILYVSNVITIPLRIQQETASDVHLDAPIAQIQAYVLLV
jgi:hypothetical protein